MAISKVNFNSLNLTPTASKTVVFNSNNNGLEAGDVGGALVLISEQTASSSATIDFTSGIDSTYKEYIFKFINVHPATDQVDFQVNFRDGSTAYDATKTTTNFQAFHNEASDTNGLAYDDGRDLAQSTAVLNIARMIGNGNDESGCGILHLFDPSNTTFVKHFILDTQCYNEGDFSVRRLIAGYCNTTSAIDGVQFSFSSGNIDSGTIKMYGVT
jgi:hypothetical protein